MSCGDGPGPVFEVFVGDRLPAFTADARDCDGPIDWTGWTLTLELRGPVVVTGSTPVVGDALGGLTYSWAVGDTAVPGDYEAVIHGVSPAPASLPQTFVMRGVVRFSLP